MIALSPGSRRGAALAGAALLLLAAAAIGRAATAGVDLGVTWSIAEGAAGGTVDASGLYTPPAAPGTYHLVATSAADPTKSDVAVITVQPAGATTRTFLSPLPDPPVGNPVQMVQLGTPHVVKDNHGAGDLLSVWGEWNGPNHWLIVSSDDGQTWRYLALPPEPNERGASIPTATGLAQDSTGRLHHMWMNTSLPHVAYSRLQPTRDVAGHVTGATWEVSDLDGPPFANVNPGEFRLGLIVAVDGTGAERLVVGFADNPSSAPPYTAAGTLYGRYQIAVSNGLAPTGAASWTGLDGTGSVTQVRTYTLTDTHTGPAGEALPLGTTSNVHQSTMAVEQHPVDRSLVYVVGPRYTENVLAGIDVRRWRFVTSGAGWILDPGWTAAEQANGKLVAGAGTVNPNLGGIFRGTTRLWLLAWRTANYASGGTGPTGLVVDAIDANDGYVFNAVPPVDTDPRMWGGHGAISSSPDDQRLWVLYTRALLSFQPDGDWSAYWDGTAWNRQQDAPNVNGASRGYGGTSGWRQGLAAIAGYKDPAAGNLRLKPYAAAIRTR